MTQTEKAVQTHPWWAAKDASGKSHHMEVSRHSPYVDSLMIPQLKEIADYGVDGAWVDGDNWATKRDYSEKSIAEFIKLTSFKNAPKNPDEPGWSEWTQFTRNSFKN